MRWKWIVVGVDASGASAQAAAIAWHVAKRTGAGFRMVHAVQDVWERVPTGSRVPKGSEMTRAFAESAEALVAQAIAGALPSEAARQLDVRVGRPPVALATVAAELDATLVVIGAKHHRGLGRVLCGGTGMHLVQTATCPVLVISPEQPTIRTVTAAVDLSHAARPVITAAQHLASVFTARLSVVHVLEPLPAVLRSGPAGIDGEAYSREAIKTVRENVWPLVEAESTERILLEGGVVETLRDEAEAGRADLLVVGTHGRGWVTRVLIGSTTASLLDRLPTSLAVVPVESPG